MRARRDADADAVGLEFLRAGKARHLQLRFGERQRGQVRIVADFVDDARDDGGLPRFVLADRGVARQHMRHLVRQHGGQFRRVAGERHQPARDVELSRRQREGVHRAGVQDRDLVGEVGPVRRCHQPVDGAPDQGFQPRVVIGAAVGGEDALMLALGRLRRRGRSRERRGLRRRGGEGGAEPAHVAASGQRKREAQRKRRHRERSAHDLKVAPRPPCHPRRSAKKNVAFNVAFLPWRATPRPPVRSARDGWLRSAVRRVHRQFPVPEFCGLPAHLYQGRPLRKMRPIDLE